MRYYCPVCAYTDLSSPPRDHTICPCCGTEFGYDDHRKNWDELRQEWMQSGAKWFSDATQKPDHWAPYQQLYGGASLLVTAKNLVELIPTEEFSDSVHFQDDLN
jgi:hypothetical protein